MRRGLKIHQCILMTDLPNLMLTKVSHYTVLPLVHELKLIEQMLKLRVRVQVNYVRQKKNQQSYACQPNSACIRQTNYIQVELLKWHRYNAETRGHSSATCKALQDISTGLHSQG